MTDSVPARIKILEAQLAQVKKERDEYLQNVSHQLTAPIGAIKMNIEALFDPDVSLKRKMVLTHSIRSQGNILVHLIKNFSLMSRIDAGKSIEETEEKPIMFDVYQLCTDYCKDFQPVGKPREVAILANESPSFRRGRPIFNGVKSLIAQVVYNLIENATKYATPHSRVTVDGVPAPKGFDVRITNSGIAVAATEVETIFERGYRGQFATAKHPAGTGLGLWIARHLMRMHGGDVTAAATGNTTVLSIHFPKERLS